MRDALSHLTADDALFGSDHDEPPASTAGAGAEHTGGDAPLKKRRKKGDTTGGGGDSPLKKGRKKGDTTGAQRPRKVPPHPSPSHPCTLSPPPLATATAAASKSPYVLPLLCCVGRR